MRRLLVLLLVVAGFGLVARGAVPCDALHAQPRCYVALEPGPARSTFDQVSLGDVRTYRSSGELVLTTVRVDATLTLGEWVHNAFDPTIAQVDRAYVFPPGADAEQVQRANELLMERSQADAGIAALRELGYDAPDGAEVVEVLDGSPAEAAGVQEGDTVVAAGGSPVASAQELVERVREHTVGDELVLTVVRGDERRELVAQLAASEDDDTAPVLGTQVRDHLPIAVSVDAGDIGGPSAGLMYALTIIDLLTEDDLTGGRVIAGTGEIDPEGHVGPIGGIRQKILGALHRDEGGRPAEVFLVPSGNVEEARGTPADGRVLLVPVATLQDALDALEALRSGREPAQAFALGG